MFRLLAFLSLLFMPYLTLAQSSDSTGHTLYKPARDFFSLNIGYHGWSDVPDSIKTGGFGRSVGFALNYDFPIQKSNFSFSIGLGITGNNVFLKNQYAVVTDTGSASSQIRFLNTDSLNKFSRFKIATAFLELPMEFRFFANRYNRNTGFKAAIGVKPGMLIGAKTKGNYKIGSKTNVAEKHNTKRYMENWALSPMLRIGYGNFSLFATYNIIPLYKETEGPQVKPFTIGLSISGL